MDIRKSVLIPNCRIEWKTNLTDDELVCVYQKILSEPEYQVHLNNPDMIAPYFACMSVARDGVDGILLVNISSDTGTILFKDLATLAREDEIEELRNEIADAKTVEKLILHIEHKPLSK